MEKETIEERSDEDSDIDDDYTPVPPNQTHIVKTRYKYEGEGEPAEFVLDDD